MTMLQDLTVKYLLKLQYMMLIIVGQQILHQVIVATNATTSTSTVNTTETQTPTLENGNDLTIKIEK